MVPTATTLFPRSRAAATRAANLVKTPADIDPALEAIASIPGVDGVLLVKDDRIGLIGRLPELVK